MKPYTILIALALIVSACQKEDIGKSGIISDHFYLDNNGAAMQVFVEGNIDTKKIVLMLHGGPGDGSLYLNMGKVNTIAEKQFAIAYWDQRLSGSSQGNSQDKNIGAYTQDLKKLIYLLRYRYGADVKIYLLAHSWGGLLAPKFLQEEGNQDMVSGWIQVDGAHNYPLNDSLSRTELIRVGTEELAACRHTEEWQEIVDYCKSHNPKNDRDVAKKINRYANETDEYLSQVNAESPSQKDRISYLTSKYNYPQTTFLVNGIYNHLIGKIEDQAYQEQIAPKLYKINVPALLLWGRYDFVCPLGLMGEIEDQAYQEQLAPKLYKINVPALLLWGRYDFVCPLGLMGEIEENISSTNVSTQIFENSGHSPMFNEPDLFWTTVTEWVIAH